MNEILAFTKKFNERFPGAITEVVYSVADNYYRVYHLYDKYTEDPEFQKVAGQLIRDMLYNKRIFNFSFSYDQTPYLRGE